MLDEIKLLSVGLEDGEHIRTHCPACNATEKSLSLSRDGDAVLYYCFRATCGASGATGSRRLVRTKQDGFTPRAKKFHPFEGELFEATQDWLDYLHEKVGFTIDHVNKSRLFVTGDGRVAFPILSPMGIRRGYVLRAYDGTVPKALTRMDCEEPHTSYYMNGASTTIVIVEDIPSAVRVSKFISCAAICGTGLSPEAVQELSATTRNIVWALDADATGEAIRQNRKNRIYFDSSRVLTLPKDFKNMTDEEITECLDIQQ